MDHIDFLGPALRIQIHKLHSEVNLQQIRLNDTYTQTLSSDPMIDHKVRVGIGIRRQTRPLRRLSKGHLYLYPVND